MVRFIYGVKNPNGKLGTGTLRMMADCEDNKYPAPAWKTKGEKLELTLNGIGHRISNDGISDGLSDGVNRIINDGVSDGVSDGVKKEIVSIVQLLARNEGLNADNIVEKLGNKSKPTIERYLKTTRILDMVVYKGSAKTGGCFLTDKMKKYKD